MKKLFLISLILVGLCGYSQTYQPYPQYGNEFKRSRSTILMGLPKDTFAVTSADDRTRPQIAAKGFKLYMWDTNPDSLKWREYTSGGGTTWGSITGTLSSQTDLNTALLARLLISDTSAMLNHYRHWAAGYLTSVDTTNIASFFSKVRSLFSAGYGMTFLNGQFKVDSSALSQYYALKKELPRQTWISDNRTGNLKLAINLGLTYKDENKAVVTLSTTKSLIHQMVYINDTIFGIGRNNPNILTRFNNLEDLTNQDSLVFNGYGDCIGGMDMVYMKNKDRLYIPTTNNDCDSAFIFEVNPHTLTKTIVFSRHSDYDFQSLTTDETYLYTVISANGAAPDSILKINLTTYAATVAAIPGTGGSPYVHCIRSDKTNIYASVYGKAMLYKIRISDLATIDSVALTSSQNTDDMDFSSDYVWIGNEGGGSTVDRVTKTSPMSLTAVNIGVSGNSFGLFNDGFYIWNLVAGTPGTLVRINPETMEIYKKVLASGENDPNEMITDGQRKFVSMYSTPSKIIRFSSPLLTYVSGGSTGTYTDEQAQDAVGAMIDGSLNYVDGTPLLQRSALTGDITASAGSNSTTLATVNSNVGSFTNANITVNAKGLVTAASNGSTVATAMPFNGLTAATGTNDINNGANNNIWRWNSLANGSGLSIYANTPLSTLNTAKLLDIQLTGANSSTSITSNALYVSNTKTGTTPVNIGIYSTATGNTATGLYGVASGTNTVGVYGEADGSNSAGVEGNGTNASSGKGVYGHTGATGGSGVYGLASGSGAGVFAENNGGSSGVGYALRASKSGSVTTGIAGYFEASGATNNYSIIVPNGGGVVGFGLSSPNTGKVLHTNGPVRMESLGTASTDTSRKLITTDINGDFIPSTYSVGNAISGMGAVAGLDSIWRTPGKDSIQFTIAGRYHAIKDSTGGGGVTFGTVYQIPVVNSGGTGFDYSSGFTKDGHDMIVNVFDNATSLAGITLNNTYSGSAIVGETFQLNSTTIGRFFASNFANTAYGLADGLTFRSDNSSKDIGFSTGTLGAMNGPVLLVTHNEDVRVQTKLYVGSLGTTPSEAIDVSGNIKSSGFINLADISAPSTPSSGYGRIYVNNDSLRFKNDGGTVFTLGLGSGGEVNTASNVGSGSGWYKTKSTYDLQFKSAVEGTGIYITANTNDNTIGIKGYDGWSNATGNTTSTSQTTIATVTPPASTRGVLEVTMIGTETSSFNKGLTGRKFVHWKSDGATVTILQIVDEEADYRETWTTASWTVTASGGNLLIRVTADNTNSTDWNTHYKLKYNTYSL